MITAAQLFKLDKTTATGLSLEFILHEYAKLLDLAKQQESSYFSLPESEKLEQSLDKLCIYCEALIQTSKQGMELLQALDELQKKAVHNRLQCARAFRMEMESSSQPLLSLSKSVRSLFSLLSVQIQQAARSETTLLALLEVRKTINAHLGTGTVEQLLQSLFPKGPQELRLAMESGFSKRGFSHIFQQYDSLFEGLTWQSSHRKS